jgi:tetratricopeptide (TPR) repeat protein
MKPNPLAVLLPAVALTLLLSGCAGTAPSSLPGCARSRQALPYDAIQGLVEAGDAQAALALYDQALGGRRAGPEDRLLRAQLLLAAGRSPEARAELESLTAEVPGQAEALATLGRMRQEAGELEVARGLFEQAIRLDADNFTALHGLGRILFEEQRYPEALDRFDRALAAEDRFSFAFADRARTRSALEDWAGAAADLDQAIRLDPQNPWSYLDRGRLRLRARSPGQAEEDFSRCLQLDPDNFLARVLRAGLLDEQGRVAEAIIDYEQALRLRPDYDFAYAPLAALHYIENNWDRAAQLFQQAFRAQAGEPAHALLAALSRKQAGQQKIAVEELRALAAGLPAESWELQAARYLVDPARELSVLGWISRQSNRVARGRLLFYLASQFLLEGRTAPALTYLAETAGLERRDLPERRLAAALLRSYGHEEGQ